MHELECENIRFYVVGSSVGCSVDYKVIQEVAELHPEHCSTPTKLRPLSVIILVVGQPLLAMNCFSEAIKALVVKSVTDEWP